MVYHRAREWWIGMGSRFALCLPIWGRSRPQRYQQDSRSASSAFVLLHQTGKGSIMEADGCGCMPQIRDGSQTVPIYFYSPLEEPYGCFSNFSPHGVELD